jgi:hypothetical protein
LRCNVTAGVCYNGTAAMCGTPCGGNGGPGTSNGPCFGECSWCNATSSYAAPTCAKPAPSCGEPCSQNSDCGRADECNYCNIKRGGWDPSTTGVCVRKSQTFAPPPPPSMCMQFCTPSAGYVCAKDQACSHCDLQRQQCVLPPSCGDNCSSAQDCGFNRDGGDSETGLCNTCSGSVYANTTGKCIKRAPKALCGKACGGDGDCAGGGNCPWCHAGKCTATKCGAYCVPGIDSECSSPSGLCGKCNKKLGVCGWTH